MLRRFQLSICNPSHIQNNRHATKVTCKMRNVPINFNGHTVCHSFQFEVRTFRKVLLVSSLEHNSQHLQDLPPGAREARLPSVSEEHDERPGLPKERYPESGELRWGGTSSSAPPPLAKFGSLYTGSSSGSRARGL